MRDFALVLAMVAACGPGTRNEGGGIDASGADTTVVDGDNNTGETIYVYAHTDQQLYKVDPDTYAITLVGTFQWPSGQDTMTDLAIDKNGYMVGVSFGAVYAVDPTNAKCTLLSATLTGTFNGVSFVPASSVGQTGDDVLVGTRNDDGMVFRIDPMTGVATAIGNMGGAYVSSGDLVAVTGFGTVQTTSGAPDDVLVRLADNTFVATPVGTGTGFGEIYGVAFWKNKIFGFTLGGEFITIDPTTGHGTLVQGGGPMWYGAAVTTSAPVLQ